MTSSVRLHYALDSTGLKSNGNAEEGGKMERCVVPVKRELKLTEIACPLQLPPLVLRQDLLQVSWIGSPSGNCNWPDGVVVAGGHILNCILGDADAVAKGDVDVFFCGPVPEMFKRHSEFEDKEYTPRQWRDSWMIDTIIDLNTKLRNFYGRDPRVTFEGGSFVMTLAKALYRDQSSFARDLDLRVQIVLQPPSKDPHDLISKFDATNCQFAYREGTIYATNESLEYLRTGVVRVSPLSVPNDNQNQPKSLERFRSLIAKYGERDYNTIEVARFVPATFEFDSFLRKHPQIAWYDAPIRGMPAKYATANRSEPIVLDDIRDVRDFIELLVD